MSKKTKRKVLVHLSDTWSKPQYEYSSAYRADYSVTHDLVALHRENLVALVDQHGGKINKIKPDDLDNSTPFYNETTATLTEGVTGTYTVPDDDIVIVESYDDYSTQSSVNRHVWVVDENSLIDFYREQSRKFARLADDLEEQHNIQQNQDTMMEKTKNAK